MSPKPKINTVMGIPSFRLHLQAQNHEYYNNIFPVISQTKKAKTHAHSKK